MLGPKVRVTSRPRIPLTIRAVARAEQASPGFSEIYMRGAFNPEVIAASAVHLRPLLLYFNQVPSVLTAKSLAEIETDRHNPDVMHSCRLFCALAELMFAGFGPAFVDYPSGIGDSLYTRLILVEKYLELALDMGLIKGEE